MLLQRIRNRLSRWGRGGVPTWYHPDYRLPITSIGAMTAMEPRRADLVAWYLVESGAIRRDDLRAPARAPWSLVALAHDPDYLETLTDPDVLARIFGVEEWDVPVDEVVGTVRLACGGTVEATRHCLLHGGLALNLLGGMHHAGRASGGGFCPLNDIAVAVAAARLDGFDGRVVVLDLDAHPPDGTADCLARDPRAWIGSISGADWGPLPGEVDETVLPAGAGDEAYHGALGVLLGRMPQAELAFVVAGGDVVAGDPVGRLGVSEAGVALRDQRVLDALSGVPSIWLPGGGYGPRAWRALAGTGTVLALGTVRPIPAGLDPLRDHFARISRELRREDLEGEAWLTEADLAAELGMPGPQASRLLGFYTAEGIELALDRFGLLGQIGRLGYGAFRVVVDRTGTGDRARLLGSAEGEEHVLIEEVLERQRVARGPGGAEVEILFVHWLTLRHPRATFGPHRPRLPGQDAPGLGMAREAGEMLARVAARLSLAGVGLRPAWYHVAWSARYEFRFADPSVQGRFEALARDLALMPLLEATTAVAEGRVRLGGRPWAWEPELMVFWLDRAAGMGSGWDETAARVREATRFEVVR